MGFLDHLRAMGIGVDQKLLTDVAKGLQWSYTKETLGNPRKWNELSADDRKIWLRMARGAMRRIAEAPDEVGTEAET